MRVVVIGGGIVGVSAALTLAEGDADVVVLERGLVASEASGLNAGVIGGGGWGQQPDIFVTLKMGSRDRFVDLSEQRKHDIGLDLTGTLILIRTEDEWEWAAATVDADRSAGRCLELLDSHELADLEPAADPSLLGAVFDPLGARAEPVAATRAFAAEAITAGAKIETNCSVTALRPSAGGGWEIEAESRTDGQRPVKSFGADAVIIAAGPWSAELGAMVGLELPIVAVRGQMWASKPQPKLLRHAIASAESLLTWSVEPPIGLEPPELTHRQGVRTTRHLYGRQRPNGEIVFGGDRVLTADRGVDTHGITVNHDHVGELLPQIRELAPVRTWAGLMPFTVDGKPIINAVLDCDGLFVAGGLASSGFGRGPMAGQLIAELTMGVQPQG